MEVTRSNFRKVLPEIEDTINRCAFMAIDGEFTGLSSGVEDKLSAFDTPAEYYCKLKKGSLDFLFVQFGLAAFIYNEEEKKYTHREYNFYLFPKQIMRQTPDCRFMCQASSLDFLATHGFDFNKLFKEGIPYLNKRDELSLRRKLEEDKDRRKSFGDQNSSFVDCPLEHTDLVNEAVNSIVDFLSTTHGLEELSLPQTNSFIRKLIYQEIWKRYTPDDLRIETKNGVMIVKRPPSPAEKEKEEKNRIEEEKRNFEDAVGFSKVIRLISQSRKLVVGHNMFLDMCHILHRFCEPLTDSYQEFKDLLHTVFPCVLDTKFMCSTRPLYDDVPSSVLAHLLATVSKPPFSLLKIDPEGEHAYPTMADREHEAGFDAYITGTIVIALYNYLAKEKNVKLKGGHKLPTAESTLLQYAINRLYLMKVIDTYVDLEGDDPNPDRGAVFHVSFPQDWKTPDLLNLFSPYGGVQISWINERSAYCSLREKSQAVNVMRQLVPDTPSGVTVTTYYAFNNLTQQSPIKRRSGELDKPSPQQESLKRKHSHDRSSLKRPSVDPIPEEPEQEQESETDGRRKRRKLSNTNGSQVKETKLFEETEDW